MPGPGGQVEGTAGVNLTSVSVRRAAAFAAASAIMSGGGMAVIPTPAPMYPSMTDRSLSVFRANPAFARPEEHLMTIPRAGLVSSETRERELNSSFGAFCPDGGRRTADSGQGLKIIVPQAGRKDRNAIAAALPLSAWAHRPGRPPRRRSRRGAPGSAGSVDPVPSDDRRYSRHRHPHHSGM
ncbi:hypothetical protein ACFWVP_14265 [Streptomyces sp. NPDC058637]|uniref:hypothetical protein n=1 Tax=Streptomyces sp. NPDC058637 TaxID=3346569 RepID=UPI003655E82F